MKTTVRKFLTSIISFFLSILHFGVSKLQKNVPRNLKATNYTEQLFLVANSRSVIQESPHNFWCSV